MRLIIEILNGTVKGNIKIEEVRMRKIQGNWKMGSKHVIVKNRRERKQTDKQYV